MNIIIKPLFKELKKWLSLLRTGAGKTFTITGATENYKHRGMIPRAIQQVFSEIDNRPEHAISIRCVVATIFTNLPLLSSVLRTKQHFSSSEYPTWKSTTKSCSTCSPLSPKRWRRCSRIPCRWLKTAMASSSKGYRVISRRTRRKHSTFCSRFEGLVSLGVVF